ncbi:pyridoxamine-phosphate oxidase [Tilletia horrida]|uniref:pyridoxal 5'-phosphate synthase n=1 Tax=Tilletia horrida TaxID=155126 RepID=A0AAN6JRL9_9BASI|nr:pyridoxamine-phosphate oxidase [Tilletia horrida]KAK0552004.1 pyridoxamine-phosphate oxidase [Tilletia horrida]KAK0566151.1 pyridoxamine-phosphate oxidase [Tilletia horrida]
MASNAASSAPDSTAKSVSNQQQVLDKITTHNQYVTEGLDRKDLNDDPFVQFHAWFKQAQDAGVSQPEAMTVSTATLRPASEGSSTLVAVPSSRVVLLKELDSQGFLFFTNYDSRKSKELAANPFASLTFFWEPLHRSVRVVGRAERLDPSHSDAYYNSRPRGSRLGAWASPQSQVIESRSVLEERVREVEQKFEGKDTINRPPFWGGWRIVPEEIEFWMGRESRLHDRFRYVTSPRVIAMILLD